MPETLEAAKTGGALQEAPVGKELRGGKEESPGHTLTLFRLTASHQPLISAGSCLAQKPVDAADLQLIKALFCWGFFFYSFCFFLCLLPIHPPSHPL